MHIVNLLRRHFVCLLTCVLALVSKVLSVGEVIWAVNCGGDPHTDIHGIRYQRDPLQEGIVSDYGKNLHIQRVPAQDQILYQTERYHVSTFGYEFPIKQDGDYLVVLKFSEVWFTAPNKKVSFMFGTPRPLHAERNQIHAYQGGRACSCCSEMLTFSFIPGFPLSH